MIVSPLFATIFGVLPGPIVTPYRQREELKVSVQNRAVAFARYSMIDLPIDLAATFDNPFDSDDIRVDAEISGTRGAKFLVPGFFSTECERQLKDGKEELKPVGKGGWHVRFCPPEPGSYTVQISVKDRNGKRSASTVVSVSESKSDGMIRLSPKDNRYFLFDSGRNYWPIGANVCWATPRGTFDYDEWFPAYGKAGCNYARVWLSPNWATFALERAGKPEEGRGMGQFDMANAWRLDYVFDLAQKNGLNLMVCIDSYNVLRDRDAYNSWETSPHNEDLGGPIRSPGQFWNSDAMARLYRDKLRYLVARYGAYSNLFAWEFWNEVDLTRDFELESVGQWHRRMGKVLRDIDPYRHLVTTSMSDPMGSRELQLLPELDFVQTHVYNEFPAESVAVQQSRKVQWGKAHFVGEIGADASGPRGNEDPEGLQIHDAIWSSIANSSSGAAMPWWWDSYIAPKNLYSIFAVAAKFVKDIDWSRESFQGVDPVVGYLTPPTKFPTADLVFDSGMSSFRAGPENQPRNVFIQDGNVSGDKVLSNLQHGMVNHPELHNPVNFEVRVSKPTRFEVEVQDVSGYGGATLKIFLDSDLVMTRDFANTNVAPKTDTLRQYAGKYGIDIPAGRHTVRVENTGADWFTCSFRFKSLVVLTKPPLHVWGSLGNNTALIWVRVQGRSWNRVIVKKDVPPAVPPTAISLEGLASGQWTAEIWDTRTGMILATRRIPVKRDGRARFDLPTVEKDVAIKMTRNQ